MAQAIFLTIIAFLAVIGLSDLIRTFSTWILSGGRRQHIISIVPCKGHEEDVEYMVKSIYAQLKQQHPCKSCRIILADSGVDEETKKACELLSEELECVSFCPQECISEILQEKFHLQINPF